jgi:hypothetical protein
MKPLFGIDLTQNKQNAHNNCEAFLVESVSSAYKEALSKTTKEVDAIRKKGSMPPVLYGLMLFFMAISVGFVSGILKSFDGESAASVSQMLASNGGVLAVGVVFWALFIGLLIYSRIRAKKAKEALRALGADRRMEQAKVAIYNELGVPESAPAVDLLFFTYHIKNGEIRSKFRKNGGSIYRNEEYRVYVEGGKLYMVSTEGKYAVDRASLCNIHMVKEPINLPVWNKSLPHYHPVYEPFEVQKTQYGYEIKYHYALEFRQDGELLGIYFPSYELHAIKGILGIA